MNRLEIVTLRHIVDISNRAVAAGESAEIAVQAHGVDRLIQYDDHHYLCPGCQAAIEAVA